MLVSWLCLKFFWFHIYILSGTLPLLVYSLNILFSQFNFLLAWLLQVTICSNCYTGCSWDGLELISFLFVLSPRLFFYLFFKDFFSIFGNYLWSDPESLKRNFVHTHLPMFYVFDTYYVWFTYILDDFISLIFAAIGCIEGHMELRARNYIS